MIFQTKFLEYPYGTCGLKALELFPTTSYTTSHCQRECETVSLIDMCNCTAPYMQGNHQPPVKS